MSYKTILLNFKNKLTYYGIVYYSLVVSALFMIGKSVDSLQDNILALELTGLTLATFILASQNKKFKFKAIHADLTTREINSAIHITAKELKWYLIDVGQNYTIAKREGGSFPFSWEEQITIKFNNKEILVNSLCNPDSTMVTIFGKNKKNIKTFERNIKKQLATVHDVSF
ncbi:MAG TPA: hypothetical protein VF985_04275 [Mariniflexile sp.]